MASFRLPLVEGNPDGWGPTKVPEQLTKVPYQQFSKAEPLGRITDWTGTLRFQGRFSQGAVPAGDQYAYVHEEDEATFQLVDSSRPTRSYFSRGVGRFRSNQAFRRQRNKDFRNLADNQRDGRMQNQGQNRRGGFRGGRQDYNRNRQFNKQREPSVPIKTEFVVIEDMEFHRMAKLSYPMKPKPSADREVDEKGKIDVGEDVVSCGALDWYDKSYDRVTVKSEKPLLRTDKPLLKHVTTTDDPVIRRLAKTDDFNVFGTDAIISTLMAASRSVYSWDIVVQRIHNKLFFDKRSKSDLDFLTVNETANEPPAEDGAALNTPKNLSLEATLTNHTFLQQVLKRASEAEPRYKFKEPNPFVSAEELDKNVCNGYKYRKFQISEGINMVVRCTIDAVTSGPSGELNLLNVKALNEWDPRFAGVDWRSKLDTQPGAVLATEMKNNSFKLARWTLSALLAGADTLKVGFVSRVNPRDPSQHAILGTQQYRPQEFANNINLNLDNAWGVLYYIIRVCMDLEDGKYLIMKDPNKPILRLYDIPDESFESDAEEESSEEETEKTAK